MLLAIDIGNTNIHVGVFKKGVLENSFLIGTSETTSKDEYSLLLKLMLADKGYRDYDITGVIIGSVCPLITGKIIDAAKKLTGKSPLVIGPGVKTGFHIKLDNPSELGADLVANSAYAISSVGTPAIVVDFGTATTICIIDKEKNFRGCYIMPGVQMGLNALEKTGLLPSVSAEKPILTLPKNSVDAMNAGVLLGQACSVKGLIGACKRELDLPDDTPIIISGGSAKAIAPYLDMEVNHVKYITLKGLNEIYRKQR